jgi:beta-glucosidase
LTYSEGYPAGSTFDQKLIDAAVINARSADVALLYVALPDSIESEGYDRSNLDLTPQEVSLIKSVTAVQPRTVVILNNGAPVVMGEWINGTAAVVEAWMMGQAGGGAIADVLYGNVNPSGKLAETFPLKLVDTPAQINFPGGNGEVHYGEGLFIGYRYYDAKEVPVQFPFGHGMSYTNFSYTNPKVSAVTFKDKDGLTVSVDVTNTGKVVGKEVVQLYVHDHKSELVRPPKELKAFTKVELQPGETRTVTLALDFRAFAYYHPGFQQWITENGEVDILIGASSADIRCIQTVTLESSLDLPSLLDRESTVREWMEDRRGKLALAPLFQQMTAQIQAAFGGGEEAGMDTLGFLMDMPLLGVLDFQGSALPMPPADLVDGLLAQVRQK